MSSPRSPFHGQTLYAPPGARGRRRRARARTPSTRWTRRRRSWPRHGSGRPVAAFCRSASRVVLRVDLGLDVEEEGWDSDGCGRTTRSPGTTATARLADFKRGVSNGARRVSRPSARDRVSNPPCRTREAPALLVTARCASRDVAVERLTRRGRRRAPAALHHETRSRRRCSKLLAADESAQRR